VHNLIEGEGDAMDIKARLDESTLRRILGDILPVTVLFDDDQGLEGRWVTIERARRVEMVAGQGVRLTTSGELRWPFKVIPVALRLASLQVLVRPVVVGEGPATRVLFRPLIEDADLRRVPDFVDRGIVAIVNRALDSRSELLAWHVANSLGRQFTLPATLGPLETATIDVVSADLKIEAAAIELSVSLDMNVTRVSESPSPPVGGGQRRSPLGSVPA
jgi:hypothetical protein